MTFPSWYAAHSLWFLTMLGCAGETLPADITDYASRCQKMNARPIPRYEGDPHSGNKNVFACNVDVSVLQANTRPLPDGAIIVKESTKETASYPWLVATARKHGTSWKWDEYTRNFQDEDFVRILASEDVCTGCHVKAEGADWIFTAFTNR